jgi:hypothetical protein
MNFAISVLFASCFIFTFVALKCDKVEPDKLNFFWLQCSNPASHVSSNTRKEVKEKAVRF